MSEHSGDCYLGGYRGPTKCCEGNCRHRVNCSCPGGETQTRQTIQAKIEALRAETAHWVARLESF